MSTNNTVSLIKESVDLPMLAGEYFPLRKSGPQWLMLCLWHEEKNPSCRVYQSHYFCFTCQAHGSAIDFLMRAEGIPFRRALEMLSARTGIPLDNKRVSRVRRAYDDQEESFASWWQAKHAERLQRSLVFAVRYLSGYECEQRGRLLRQLCAVKGEQRRALVARAATAEERREWEEHGRWEEWFKGMWMGLA